MQAVINAARSGNKIIISGVCAGNYRIGKNLTLEGASTSSVPTPTLDGNKRGSVIKVTAGTIRIKKLTIQNGYALNGGGIDSSASGYSAEENPYYPGGNVILNATTLQWNTAFAISESPSGNGGGVHIGSYENSLTLNNGSRVVNNTSDVAGGGIYTDGGAVTLNGNARVGSNRSAEGGGIYSPEGNIWLRGTSSVRGNQALGGGGGIYSDTGDVYMDGSSLVTGNQASTGGGIFGWDVLRLAGSASVLYNTATGRGGGGIDMYTQACDGSSPSPWVGAISPNSPDDLPLVDYVPCT